MSSMLPISTPRPAGSGAGITQIELGVIGATVAIMAVLFLSVPGHAAVTSGPANPEKFRADQPVPRTDQNSQTAHQQLLAKAARGGIDIYFEGDSITRRWGASDEQYRDLLANWTQNFHGWNAANFGWGGDTVQSILWRLQNGELDGVHPKIIVLLAGTNNLGGAPSPEGDETKVEEVVGGLRAILKVMREKAPDAVLIVMGITPRVDAGGRFFAPMIARINARLSELAKPPSVRFLNLNDRLANQDGKPVEGMTTDGLHLSTKGYQVWADALKPVFTEVLGPPAQTDHAPPPTGDPSASKPPTEFGK